MKHFTILLAIIVLLAVAYVAFSSSKPSKIHTELLHYQSAKELKSLVDNPNKDMLIIDVRSPEEFGNGHIPTAINIPITQFSKRLNEIPRDKALILYCRTGRRVSVVINTILKPKGYEKYINWGSISKWTYPVDK